MHRLCVAPARSTYALNRRLWPWTNLFLCSPITNTPPLLLFPTLLLDYCSQAVYRSVTFDVLPQQHVSGHERICFYEASCRVFVCATCFSFMEPHNQHSSSITVHRLCVAPSRSTCSPNNMSLAMDEFVSMEPLLCVRPVPLLRNPITNTPP